MSKLFRTFGSQNPSSQSNSLYSKEEAMQRNSTRDLETETSYTPKAELPSTNLSVDVEIKGSIKFKESLRLDGSFEGELSSEEGLLIIGKNGNIRATINVGSIIVEGKLYGNIHAKDKVELRSTAQNFGDIKASRLIVEEGVVFVGKCDVNPKATKIEPIRPEVPVNEKEEKEKEEEKIMSDSLPEEETSDDLQKDFLQ